MPPVNHPPKQQARPMPPPARSILPTENEVKKDIQVQEVDRISMMTQLAQEFGMLTFVLFDTACVYQFRGFQNKPAAA